MHVSWYQSIEMHYIVLPVKFDGGLFISVVRNEQLFTKYGGGSKNPMKRVSLFVEQGFSRKRDNKIHLKFYMKRLVLLICRMMLRIIGFGG
jgi:hypothetical protein